MKNARAALKITGFVQGVGYRYFCYREASQRELVGWVRNERDGSVSVEAEGPRQTVESFVDRVERGPSGARVDKVQVTWREATGEDSSFDIVH
jgi:acylphosphatase